jgi:hypothetical protein
MNLPTASRSLELIADGCSFRSASAVASRHNRIKRWLLAQPSTGARFANRLRQIRADSIQSSPSRLVQRRCRLLSRM